MKHQNNQKNFLFSKQYEKSLFGKTLQKPDDLDFEHLIHPSPLFNNSLELFPVEKFSKFESIKQCIEAYFNSKSNRWFCDGLSQLKDLSLKCNNFKVDYLLGDIIKKKKLLKKKLFFHNQL